MQQRDIIKDEIEQVGKVLGKIIADFFNLKSEGDISVARSTTQEALKNSLDIDVVHLMELDTMGLESYFLARNISEDHVELLAQYFQELGGAETEPLEANRYLEKAIAFLDTADALSHTKSFTRMMRKDELEKMMKDSEH